MGILHLKDAGFQIQGVAVPRYRGGPFGALFSGVHRKSMTFEELHLTFVPSGCVQGLKGAQVSPFSSPGMAFA